MAAVRKKMPKTKAAKEKMPKFRYVVKVVETVESQTAVDSDVKLPWNAIQKIAEERMVKGTLSFCGVTDVDMWVCDAYVDGKEIHKMPSDRKRK